MSGPTSADLAPFVPRIAIEWDLDTPDAPSRVVDGTLVFVDISGFTALSERLARRGRIGAEQLTDVLRLVFSEMLSIAYARGGSLLKFGGDALLLMFSGPDHALRASKSAVAMQGALREVRRTPTAIGRVSLKMSVGVHSGAIHLFRVGHSHRELLIVGPAASATTRMEHAAEAGEILVSDSTAAFLPARRLGAARAGGRLLRWRVVAEDEQAPILGRPVAPEDVARALPVVLRQHLGAGGLDSEHRIATIAFLRYRGIDRVLAEEGEAAAAVALDAVISAVQTAADQEGVTFLATDIDEDGGKVILAGGVPGGLDDDEGRVLRTVRAVLDVPLPLPLHAGVNRGHVFAGEIGTQFRRTYTVMGDTVNLAARLMAAAPPGGAFATSSALDRARTVFDATPLAPFSVKGKAEPVQAYAVGEALGQRTESRSRSRFTGRSTELARLVDAVDRAAEGAGSALLIEGERGLGKSRLLDELRESRPRVRTIVLQGEPYGTASAFLAFRAPLISWLSLGSDAPELLASRLASAVEARAPDFLPLVPLLGPIFGIAIDDTPATAVIAREFRHERLGSVVEALLDSPNDAGGSALLFVVEDAHWLDEPSAALLDRLATRVATHPWLLVATRRPDGGGYRSGETMTLGPLHGDDAQLLVEHVTEGSPLRPGEVATLVERAGGSPLFLEELVRGARDLGVDGLPESLDGVAAAEIDALAPLARTALRMAAVLGRSFESSVLVRMLEEDDIVLDDATQQDLARFLVADGPDRLQFQHALQREAAYEGLSFGRRRHLHARAAHTLLRHPESSSEVRPDLLSLHFTRAHDWEHAWEYAMQAGLEAEFAYAAREVVTHFGHAIEAARRMDAIDRDVLSWIWERLGDAHDILGSLPEADAAYRRAAQLLDDGDAVNLARLGDKRVVVVGEHQHRHAAAVRIARRFRRVLGDRADPPAREVRAQLLAHEAAIRYHEGRFRESVKLCEAAVAETEPGEEPLALATALSVSDMARYRLGLPGDPALTERALTIFERHHDLLGVAVTLSNLGVLAYFDGRWDAAADLYQRAVTAADRAGDAVEAAVGAANLAELRINQGRITEAEALVKPAVRTLDAMAETLQGAFASMQMGRIETTRLDVAAMRTWMEQAVSAYDNVGANEDATLARAFFAESEVLTNGIDAAAELVRQARTGAPIDPEAPAGVLLDRVEAMVSAARGDLPEARVLAARAVENARESGAYYDLVVALELSCRLAAGDGRDAELERERDRWIGDLGIEGPIRSGPPAT